MRIIYLHQYFNTPTMSGGTRSYEMGRRMVDAGFDVHMVTSYRDNGTSQTGWFSTEEAGICVHWYPVPYSNEMGYVSRIKAFLSFAWAARRKAIELEGDIVFATSTPLTIALPAIPAARKKGVPMVFEVRDLWPEMPIAVGALKNPILRFAAKVLERWAYRNSDAIIALSPGMKSGIVRTGYPEERVAVIPNSCDNEEFRRNDGSAESFRSARHWLGDKPLLVYTGTFGAVNGVSFMIPVASELLKLGSDVRILLVGEGAEKDLVTRQAELAGVLNNNLFIENGLPKKDIPALLSAADVASVLFIDLPEMRVNSANKFFDALAAGTPVMLNYGGWMHDLVESRGCGLAFWQLTPHAIAVELDQKMRDRVWLKQAGEAGRQLAEEHFDRDNLAAQLIAVLREVSINRKGSVSHIAPGKYS